MTITSEMLAAYAEGKVSDSERDAVRKYLADNPSELQSVVMMMDEDYDYDYDLDLDLDVIGNGAEQVGINEGSFPTYGADSIRQMPSAVLCCSAAAFASGNIRKKAIMTDNKKLPKESFDKRLNDFMDDLGI